MGKIDTSGWKEFRVGELFEVKISKSVDKGGLEFAEDGEYDFIGRTPLNNGIQGKLNKLKFEANQEGTYSIAQIGMHVCQYRERKWYASQNLFVLTPFTEKSHKANKFIATVITRYLDCAYGEDTYATYPTVKTLPLLVLSKTIEACRKANGIRTSEIIGDHGRFPEPDPHGMPPEPYHEHPHD